MSDFSEALPPKPANKRRRAKQTVALEERLALRAKDDRERARSLPPSKEREDSSPPREAHRRSRANDRISCDAVTDAQNLKRARGRECERQSRGSARAAQVRRNYTCVGNVIRFRTIFDPEDYESWGKPAWKD